MTTIDEWLRDIGLEQYVDVFQKNDIDEEVLPDLSESDLEKIGISLGHRKKILRAIASLTATEPPSNTGGTGTAGADGSATSDTAERRQLTVMFCDLVGSTALSTRLDPEDLRKIIVTYQEAAAAEITRFGGHIAKFMGDGVLAYFGWPRAHENDAERAARSGLELVQVIGGLAAPDKTNLSCRVGIATGPVVVGDLIGEGASQEAAVVGETPNLAARLEALAKPGQVVVASSTRRLLGGLFNLAELGKHNLKGFDQPIEAWRVLGERDLESRFDARGDNGSTPIVGRDREISHLKDLWAKIGSGEGHVVLLSGEAGIGKSRLVEELRSIASHDAHTRLRYQCSPFHENSPLHPVVLQIGRAGELHASDTDEAKLDKIEQLLAMSTNQVGDVAPLFAALLSIQAADRYPRPDMSPQKRKDLTLDAIVQQLIGLSARQPVLVLFEDLHWIDPTSVELLDRIIERVSDARALVVLTFRPEFKAPWVGMAQVTSFVLNRLGASAGIDVIRRVTGNKALPPEVEEQILAKTDGVPLFVEELTKNVLESGLVRVGSEEYQLVHDLPPFAIPETLHDSLMARLDRLAPVKEVAQIGAVLGREFSYEVLAAISDLDDQGLTHVLDQLSEAELVFARGRPPNATYIFKHALVQDAAYGSLLRSRRQQLHARVAHTLETCFPTTIDHEPETIARHFSAAGQAEKAIGYWYVAAELANIRSANAEAEGHIKKALVDLDHLPAGIQSQQRIKLLTLLGRILTAKSGYGHADVAKVYSEARKLCESAEDDTVIFPVLLGLSIYSAVRTELATGTALSHRLIEIAAARNDAVWTVEANYAAGITYSWRGAFKQARYHLELAYGNYDTDQHAAHLALYGQDGGPVCLCRNAMVLWYLGYPDQALSWMNDALSLTEQLGHPFSRIYILTWAAWLRLHRRELKDAAYWNEQTLAYATEQKFPFWAAMATVQRGWLIAEGGEPEGGIATMKAGVEQLRQHGTEVTQAYSMGLAGDALGKTAQTAVEGASLIEEGLEKIAASKEEWCKAELLRLRGNIQCRMDPTRTEDAERWYANAIEVAKQEEAKGWELRAATSLAQLLAGQDRREEALGLLKPVVGWFKEGHATPDLKDAKALLDGLR